MPADPHPPTPQWHLTCEELRTFVERHGRMPLQSESSDGRRLQQWLRRQCVAEAAGRLHNEAARALESIPGWAWGADQWDRRAHLLEQYVTEHGKLPRSSVVYHGARIGHWAKQQRYAQRTGALNGEREARLTRIPGWTTGPERDNNELHRQRVAELRRAVAATGTALIDDTWRCPDDSDRALWAWTQQVRNEHQRGRLARAAAATFEALPDWTWDPRSAAEARDWRLLARRCAEVSAAGAGQSGPGVGRIRDGYAKLIAGTLDERTAGHLATLAGWDELETHATKVRQAWQIRLQLAAAVRHPGGDARTRDVIDDIITSTEPVLDAEIGRRWGHSRQWATALVGYVRSQMLHPRTLAQLTDTPPLDLLEMATAARFDRSVPTPAQLHQRAATGQVLPHGPSPAE